MRTLFTVILVTLVGLVAFIWQYTTRRQPVEHATAKPAAISSVDNGNTPAARHSSESHADNRAQDGTSGLGRRSRLAPTGNPPPADAGLTNTLPAEQTRARPEPPLVPAATQTTTPPAPQPTPTSQPTSTEVRWAGDPERKAARAQAQRAAAMLKTDPYHPLALQDLADALQKLGHWSEAAEPLRRLTELYPEDAQRRFNYAAVLARLRRWAGAAEQFEQVVTVRPDWTEAWYNLAVARQATGKLAASRDAYTRAIELAPAQRAAYMGRGEVRLDLHDWSGAAADFEEVRQRSDTPTAACLLNLALAQWKLGRSAAARGTLRGLLQSEPRHVVALNRLAQYAWESYAASGDAALLQTCIAQCEKSLALIPEQPEIVELLDVARAAE